MWQKICERLQEPTSGPIIYGVSGHRYDSPTKNTEADILINTRILAPSELAEWAPQCREGWQIAKGARLALCCAELMAAVTNCLLCSHLLLTTSHIYTKNLSLYKTGR